MKRSSMAKRGNRSEQVAIRDVETCGQEVHELVHARFLAAIKEGEADMRNGLVEDVDSAFAEIRRELGLIGDA